MVSRMLKRGCNTIVTLSTQIRHIPVAYTTVPDQDDIRCPNCNSDALYKYGKSKAGKQRFLCLMCKRQFTNGAQRLPMKNKPTCPECRALRRLYKREAAHIRFRCSKYPACRTFIKIAVKMEN